MAFAALFPDIITVVTGAADAVHTEIVDLGCGDVNRFCSLVPGEIAWDECDCGQFAQTITQTYPSNLFPLPVADDRHTACGPVMLAVSVTASLTRCVPGPSDNGAPPTCDALLASSIILECDRQALRKAITCYLQTLRDTYQIHEFAVGAVTTVGPQGGCVGVELVYQFGVSNICCD